MCLGSYRYESWNNVKVEYICLYPFSFVSIQACNKRDIPITITYKKSSYQILALSNHKVTKLSLKKSQYTYLGCYRKENQTSLKQSISTCSTFPLSIFRHTTKEIFQLPRHTKNQGTQFLVEEANSSQEGIRMEPLWEFYYK